MIRGDLQEILWLHSLWLNGEDGGVRADLRNADLKGNCLSCQDIRGALLPESTPVVPNIDKVILDMIEAGGHLNMDDWHTCSTSHCRAGWAIHLAGEAGRKLAEEIGSAAAGSLIYAASRPNMPVPDFYGSDEVAMEDIRRCSANVEAA